MITRGFVTRFAATTATTLFLLGVVLALSGCVSSKDAELAQLLRELDLMEARQMMPEEPAAVDVEVPETVTPVAAASEPPSGHAGGVTIHPDCLLQITVAEDPSLNGSYKANDIGAVEVGYLGPIILYNATEREAEEKIERVLKIKDFINATVKVRILRASYGQIRVDGAVESPGYLKVGAGDTISLNNALLRAGGLSASARGGKVRVFRGALLSPIPLSDQKFEEYSLESTGGEMSIPNVVLGNSDVAIVIGGQAPKMVGGAKTVGDEGRDILVLGEVTRPGMLHFASGDPCTVLHLFLKMGGLPPFADKKHVRVVRRDEFGSEVEYLIDVAELLGSGSPDDDFPLEDGDRVIVPARRFSIL